MFPASSIVVAVAYGRFGAVRSTSRKAYDRIHNESADDAAHSRS